MTNAHTDELHCPTTQPHNPVQSAARGYISRGFCPIPVRTRTKIPIGSRWQDSRIQLEDIPEHFPDPKLNIGLVLGDASKGLVDIDIDDPVALRIADHFLPETGMVTGRASTPASHRFYRVAASGDSKKYQASADHGGVLVEYRANGCQTVMPPSIHLSGEAVSFVEDGQPASISREDLVQKTSHLAAATLIAKVWGHNARHDMSLALSGGLAKAGWEQALVEHFIEGVCLAANDDELADRRKSIQSTFERFKSGEPVVGWPGLVELVGQEVVGKIQEWLCLKHESTSAHSCKVALQSTLLSDGWVKDRFVESVGKDVFYNSKRKEWMVWNGAYWESDDKEQALKKLESLVRDLQTEALSQEVRNERDQLVKHLLRCDSYPKLRDILALSRMHLAIDDNRFDTDPYLLNVANGTLNLTTGVLQAFCRTDFLSRTSAVRFDADAKCPVFDAFIDEISLNRPELVAYLQRVLGYAMTGDTKAQAFFVLYGNGANGKSTLLNIVKRILGPYAQQASIRTFTNHDRQQTNDLADLKGARLVSVSEAEQTHKFSEALIKQLTGGDSLRARQLYQKEIEFTPQSKYFIGTNYLPEIKGTDGGIWRRVNLIPFDFKAQSPDQDLPEKLWKEASGILNWLLKGCLAWQVEGLNPPSVVADSTNKYRKTSDIVGLFLDEMCVAQVGSTVSKKELYDGFVSWCDEMGHDKIAQKVFGEALLSRGFRDGKRTTKSRTWQGLKLFASELEKDLQD